MDKEWRRILDEDRDWDWYFLLVIMRHKLERMSKMFKSEHAVALHSEDRAAEMDIVIDALNRLIEDNYIMDYDSYEQMQEAQSKDLDIAFDTMKENILGWWD